VRVIAATNQDLWGMVQEKKFRADLYYRLNVFPINLPPLRERDGDIPLLASHFVRKFAERQGKMIDCIPEEVLEALEGHYWPGNIRELQNFIERAVIMTTGSVLRPRLAELLMQPASTEVRTLEDAERAHIVATLRETLLQDTYKGSGYNEGEGSADAAHAQSAFWRQRRRPSDLRRRRYPLDASGHCGVLHPCQTSHPHGSHNCFALRVRHPGGRSRTWWAYMVIT